MLKTVFCSACSQWGFFSVVCLDVVYLVWLAFCLVGCFNYDCNPSESFQLFLWFYF